MPLTDTAIRNAKPGPTRRKLSDGGGLHVEVSPRGTKTWKMAYRFGGKQKTVTGGRYPDITLAEARGWRETVKADLRAGRDPARVAKVEKQIVRETQVNTFEAVAREWFEKNRKRWKSRYGAQLLVRLERDPFVVFGSAPVADITHRDILDLIERYEKRGAHEVCRKVLAHVSAIIRYARASGYRQADNPVPDTKDVLAPRPPVKNMAKLPIARLPEFFGRLARSQHDDVTKLALRWTILTWARTNETRFATLDEIEARGSPDALWRLSAERMKKAREHLVPLPRQADALLDRIEENARRHRSRWMFPQPENPDKPISENRMLYALYDLGYKGVATVHGFRGVASTYFNEQVDADGRRRWDADWIEMQLAHAEDDDSRGAYNAAQYLVPRRRMLGAWADFLDECERMADLL